ncbi:MAG: hypothetical protein ABFC24_11350 [Methanoregulaceae archaeon]
MDEDDPAPRVLKVGRLYEEEIPAAPLPVPLSREDLDEMEHEVRLSPLRPHEEPESVTSVLPGHADPFLDGPGITTDMRESGRHIPLDFFTAHKQGLLGPGEEVDLSKEGRWVDNRTKTGRRRARSR